MRRSVLTLAATRMVTALVAEGLVGAVEAVGHQFELNQVFMGVVVLAMVGNAAENSSAVNFAYRDRMDLALNTSRKRACKSRCSSPPCSCCCRSHWDIRSISSSHRSRLSPSPWPWRSWPISS